MQKYNPKKIEAKWQKYWEKHNTFKTLERPNKKQYVLDMLPYISAAGLHVGHPEGYTATDIISRYLRMNGYDVLHPMGWDAFGLPTENYAIKTGIHPSITTKKGIDRFREQIKSLGLSYDWEREVNTSDPNYYKWTQWLFLMLYKNGLAYKKEAYVNWCPKDNTVLANEQVVNGKCERCGTEVVQKLLSQWFFKTTSYAERLLSGLDKLDWPEPIKTMQRNWIGKSEGAEIDFPIVNPRVKRFIILHGKGSTAKDNFYLWLKKELESKGFEVEVPALPHTEEPNDLEQADYVLKNCKIDAETELIGHSMGGIVALRILEQGVKVHGVVLVATPASGIFLDGISRPTVTAAARRGFDFKKIKKNSDFFKVISDETDHIIPADDAEIYGKNLKTVAKSIMAVKSHFGGKHEPALLEYLLPNIRVFTTRPDTIFGATYLVLAPESPFVQSRVGIAENRKEIEQYVEAAKKKNELQRTQLEKDKTGVELKSLKVINPATGEQIPVWIADFVLSTYGTGAVFADAHDERDFEFAKKYKIPLKTTLKPKDGSDDSKIRNLEICFTEKGILYNSGEFDGLTSEEAIPKIGKKFGKMVTKYKLRDWLVSRQRYWGSPIPIIYCEKCGPRPVPEKDLPVKLPTDVDFLPTGESPLARSKSFHKVKCPNCKGPGKRDSDTMDTFVDSSWYFYRYTDPDNKKEFSSKEKIKTWLPVDTYVGGAEHAVLHLLYSRFFTKVLFDFKYVTFEEPFLRLRNQGLILGPDGEKMSKSRGNVINPDDIIKEFGADSLRMYEMFMGPLEDTKPWNTKGLIGLKRFLDRVWEWVEKNKENRKIVTSESVKVEIQKLIKKITEDIENYKFNTAISAFMEFHNKIRNENISVLEIKQFLILLYPFAPHIAEELNEVLGGKKSLQGEAWPKFDAKKIVADTVNIVVQINGKIKDKLTLPIGSSESSVKNVVLELQKIKQALGTETIKRVVYVPDRLINLVI